MLIAVGLDRRVATAEDREVLATADQGLAPALAAFGALDGVDELAVLSTGHRVEVYAATRFPAVAAASLRLALTRQAGRPLPFFELHGPGAFRHLVRVASSLDPVLLGEPHILGQVRDAFALAAEAGLAGRELAGLAARALEAAGRVRRETTLGRAGRSWGHAVATLAEKVLGPLAGRRVLILGAGEMARLSAHHLAPLGAELTIRHGAPEVAEALAREVGGRHGGLDGLAASLEDADVVVSTAPVAPAELAPGAVARLMARRRRRLVLVDLSVPPALQAAAGALEDVFLCDAADLHRVMQAATAGQARAAADAERIVEAEVARLVAAEPGRGRSAGAAPRGAARAFERGEPTEPWPASR